MEIIEKFQIDTTNWKELGYFLGRDPLGSFDKPWGFIFDDNYQVLDRTGWILVKDSNGQAVFKGKLWFLHGVRVTPLEVFDSLTDEEKENAIWDLDEWK